MQPVDGQICRHSPKTSDDLLEMYRLSNAAEDFERIVRRFAALVLCECRRVTGNIYDAEDASQMVFLALAMEIKSGVTIRQPGAWLKRVARRQALKVVRSRTRRRRREDAARRSEIHLVDADSPIDSTVIAGIIRDEIDQLPERYRLAVILHYFGGMTLELIAQELRITRPAVGTRLHRGRKMLAERLSRQGVRLNEATLTAALGVLVPATVVGAVLRAATRQPAPAVTAMPAAMRQMLQTITMATVQRPLRMATLSAVLALGSTGMGLVIDHKAALLPKIGGSNPLQWIWQTLRQKTSFHFQISSNEKSTETMMVGGTKLAAADRQEEASRIRENWSPRFETGEVAQSVSRANAIDSAPIRNFAVANDVMNNTAWISQNQNASRVDAAANAVIRADHVAPNARTGAPIDEGMLASSAAGGHRFGASDTSITKTVVTGSVFVPLTTSNLSGNKLASVNPAVVYDSMGAGVTHAASINSGTTSVAWSNDGGSDYDGVRPVVISGLNPAAGGGQTSADVAPTTTPEPGVAMVLASAFALVGRRTRNRKRCGEVTRV
jgi:RNA polymerase sigma factor (sigma-70 family)